MLVEPFGVEGTCFFDPGKQENSGLYIFAHSDECQELGESLQSILEDQIIANMVQARLWSRAGKLAVADEVTIAGLADDCEMTGLHSIVRNPFSFHIACFDGPYFHSDQRRWRAWCAFFGVREQGAENQVVRTEEFCPR